MKKNLISKIAAFFRSMFIKQNYEWFLANEYRKIDTKTIDIRKDISVNHL